MPSISTYFLQAQLALAAYAKLLPGAPNVPDLQRAGFTVSLAKQFGDKWIVIDQSNDPGSGLSATVFKEISTGRRYLAIRGTDDLIDVATDLFNIGLIGTTTLQPQYRNLRAKVQTWIDNGTLPANFTVTGHSLGGFLATGIAAEFSSKVEHAYLYNAPGLNGVLGIATAPLLRALGISAPVAPAKVSNIKADVGVSPIAGLGAQVGLPIRVVIENQFNSDVPNPPAARNHGQDPLTDALAIYALFAAVDPSFSTGQIGDLLRAASAQNNRTLESGLDALRKIFGLNGATQIEQRESLYTNLYDLQSNALFQSVANTELGSNASAGRIVSLVNPDGNQLWSRARSDFGYLFALNTLSPFAVVGVGNILSATYGELYRQWQADQSLTTADRAAGGGNFSDTYLRDRAQFLTWKNQKNLDDIADGVSIRRKDNGVESFLYTDKTLKDAQGQDYSIRVVGGNPVQQIDPIRISFASSQGGTLQGGRYDDHLYGGGGGDVLAGSEGDDYLEGGAGEDTLRGDAGNDTLIGGTGVDTLIGGADDDTLRGGKDDDILQGGAGNDTYWIRAGDGLDTILDHEGRNTIVYEDASGRRTALAMPAFAVAGATNTWRAYLTGGDSVTFTQNSPLTALLPDGSQLVIDDYQDGDFGIQLKDLAQSEPETTGLTLLGDHEPLSSPIYDAQGQVVYGTYYGDDFGNDLPDLTAPAPDREDWFIGTDRNDFIAGFGGEDRIYAGDGADRLQGGAGADRIYGEGGDDVIEGQDDTSRYIDLDYVSGGAGDDWIFATAECDIEDALAYANDEGVDERDIEDALLAYANDEGVDTRGARMLGEAGDDVIVGSTGWDRIAGGAGSDILIGGGGSDRIRGDADYRLTIYGEFGPDQGTASEDADVIYGGGGGDSIRGGLGDDYVDGGDGDDSILGEDGSDTLFGGAGDDIISAVRNEMNGAVFDESDEYIDGGDGNDLIDGSAGDNILLGGDGDDQIIGAGGNDYVDGGGGDDRLQGNDAHGGPGNDVISGTPGADTLYGDDGDDMIFGWNVLWASPYALEYVAGDDWLYGGAGDDTYVARIGTGPVHIVDDSGVNRIELMSFEYAPNDPGFPNGYAPIARNSIHFEYQGGTYKLIYGDAGDRIELGAAISGATLSVSLTHARPEIRFDENWDLTKGLPKPTYGMPTEVLSWSDLAVTQDCAPEGGTLIAVEGLSNTLEGNAGSDTIVGASGDDVLKGDAGDDSLDGGDGGDRYVFEPGDGIDVISDSGTQGTDTLAFGAGISADALTLGTGSLLIRIGDTGDAIHIDGFDLEDALAAGGIELFEFADGTVLSHAQLVSRGFDLYGTDGDDTTYGTSVVDRFHQSAGDDTLIGGSGDDVYYFDPGSGHDLVVDQDATPGNADTIVLGTGIAPEDLSIASSPGMLTLAVAGTGDSLDIQWQSQDGYAIERITFADGTLWDGNMLESQAVPASPADGGGQIPAGGDATGSDGGSTALVDVGAADNAAEPQSADDTTPPVNSGTALAETTPTDAGAEIPVAGETNVSDPAGPLVADAVPVVVETPAAAVAADVPAVQVASDETQAAHIDSADAGAETPARDEVAQVDNSEALPAAADLPAAVAETVSNDNTSVTASGEQTIAEDAQSVASRQPPPAEGSPTLSPATQSTAVDKQADALLAALGVTSISDAAAASLPPRNSAKTREDVGLAATGEHAPIASGPTAFFTALQPARPNLQSWLDNWLGPSARANTGSKDKSSATSSGEDSPPLSEQDGAQSTIQDTAPPSPAGEDPDSPPAEALTPEEIAQSYEYIALWLDANSGIEAGIAGESGAAPEKNLFNFMRSAVAGDGTVTSSAAFGQSPGLAAIGGHALQPLRGISEGYAALGLM